MNIEELSSTPSEYYALAYWLGCLLYIRLHSKRHEGKMLWLKETFMLVLMIGTVILTKGQPVVFYWICMVLNIIYIYIDIYICCDMTPAAAGYYCVKAFIFGEFAASLEWQLYYFCLAVIHGENTYVVSILFLAVVFSIIFFIVYLFEKKYKNEKVEIHKSELLSAVTIGLVAYIVSNLSYAYKNTPFSGQFPLEIFIIRTLADLGALAALYAYHAQLHDLSMKKENDFLQNMIRMQYNDYQKSEESIAVVNQKYHDLKHAIALLKTDISGDEKMTYLNQIEDDIRSYEARNKTGNKVLDTILTSRTIYGQKFGVTVTCVADGQALDFISAIDISTLFGNALDNALEAAKRIPDSEGRSVHLSICRKKTFLCINIQNPYVGNLNFLSGIPVTTKADHEFHGYGLKSIRSIVEKYGGDMKISSLNNWFELHILIPVPNEKYGKKV